MNKTWCRGTSYEMRTILDSGSRLCTWIVIVCYRQFLTVRELVGSYHTSLWCGNYHTLQQITPSQQTSFLPHCLAQSDCLAANRQGQVDTRLTLTPSFIPNSNYVIMVGDWKCLKYCIFACFLYRNGHVHRDFLITQFVPFWYTEKLDIGRCRFDLVLVLMLCISEFTLK
jgi:hypothetical protein